MAEVASSSSSSAMATGPGRKHGEVETVLVPVFLDLALGEKKLQDSFNWPLKFRRVHKEVEFSNGNPVVFEPIDQDQLQLFATQLCSDLDMPSAFDTAVAKAIRSQLNAFEYMFVGREKLLVRKKIGLENYKLRKAESLAWLAAEERRRNADDEPEMTFGDAMGAEGAAGEQEAAAKKKKDEIEIPVVENPPGIEISHKEQRVTLWFRTCAALEKCWSAPGNFFYLFFAKKPKIFKSAS
jgi:hypothetical protein